MNESEDDRMAKWLESEDLSHRLGAYCYMASSENPRATELLVKATQKESDYWALELALGCLFENSIPSLPAAIGDIVEQSDAYKALIAVTFATQNEIWVREAKIESLLDRSEWFLKLSAAIYLNQIRSPFPANVLPTVELELADHRFENFRDVAYGVFGLRLLAERDLALESIRSLKGT